MDKVVVKFNGQRRQIHVILHRSRGPDGQQNVTLGSAKLKCPQAQDLPRCVSTTVKTL